MTEAESIDFSYHFGQIVSKELYFLKVTVQKCKKLNHDLLKIQNTLYLKKLLVF